MGAAAINKAVRLLAIKAGIFTVVGIRVEDVVEGTERAVKSVRLAPFFPAGEVAYRCGFDATYGPTQASRILDIAWVKVRTMSEQS